MRFSHALAGAFAAALTLGRLWAGESGLNVAVVVNQNSTNSMQLANTYCEQRGVPPQNVLFVTNQWSGGSISCSVAEFQTGLVSPLFNMLQSRNLTNQVQVVLLSMDIPYQIYGTNGLNSATSILFYGFKPDTAPPATNLPTSCSLPDNSSNSYAFSELPFSDSPPNAAATNSFMAVMLTDTTLAGAENILSRGVASDSSFPVRNIFLDKTSDPARNVRFTEFDNAILDTHVQGDFDLSMTNTDSTAFTNLLGLETGLTTFSFPSNAFVPGTIADDLTSFGGYLFTYSGQTPILAFLDAGAALTYGTVVEPCNYVQKFPNPLDYFYQARGFSLVESYYQSIQNPYQGIMVGEPLAAPFALRGNGNWNQLSTGVPVLAGQTNLQLSFAAAAPNLPLSRVDLFVDGTWFKTITNIPPTAGDQLTVVLEGVTNTYTVPTNASIQSVAAGLSSVLNAASNSTFVTATPMGDRIELRSTVVFLPGSNITVTASATNHGGVCTTFLTSADGTFVDSGATGYQTALIENQPAPGDWIQLVATKTNGASVTVSVTNTNSSGTLGQLTQALQTAVNSHPALRTADGLFIDDLDAADTEAEFNVYARSAGWPASTVQAALTVSSNLVVLTASPTPYLQGNMTDLEARNHLYVAAGSLSLPVNYTIDTTQFPDGYHELTAIAYEGTSVRTQTRATQSVLIQNNNLIASLNTLVGGSNTDLKATLQFSVSANTSNITTVQLYSTGGLIGAVTNPTSAFFAIAATTLGLGLHPFYAIVTDTAGHQYRTATTSIRLISAEPPFTVAISNPPLTLRWPATAGRTYDILNATNLLGPFQTIATVTPPNSAAVWVDPNTHTTPEFYLIETSY